MAKQHNSNHTPSGGSYLQQCQTAGSMSSHKDAGAEKELGAPASRDNTTGLPNTARLEYDLRQNISDQHLLILDIIKLKKINKIYGRDSGDALLRLIRDFILGLNIANSALYRVNTGDFCLLIADSKGDANLPMRIAKQIRERLQKEWIIQNNDTQQHIFASANICIMPLNQDYYSSFFDLQSAIEYTMGMTRSSADIAIYNEELLHNYRHKKALESGFKKAVHSGMADFHLMYQPILEPGVAKWSGLEALCRWNGEEFGEVKPEEFIPIAETCGLINNVGLWILEQAIMQAKQWQLDKADRFILYINLSPLQFETPNFQQIVAELLEKHAYPPQKLCLEVTESGNISFSEYTVETMHRLCAAGVLLALDNFGAGFSTLELLHKLPIKLLKTDHSYLTDLSANRKQQNLFRFIIELAHSTDMKVIARGVETDEQAKFLLKQGADYLQGFHFSHPLTPQQLTAKLHNFSSPSADLVYMGFGKADISSPQSKPKYELNSSQYRMLYDCIHEVFASADHHQAINTALAHVGNALRVSRAYVFLKEADGSYSNSHEWCAPGINAERATLQYIPMDKAYPQWIAALHQDGLLMVSDIHTLQGQLFKNLARQGIKSILIFPVWKEQELHGFVGFDDCEKARVWTPEEVQLLHTLTGIITSSLAKMWLQKTMETQNIRREIVLNSLDIAIHVTDVDTSEILFANSGLTRLYGNQSFVGKKCWEVLESRDEACPFCPRQELLKNLGSIRKWDHYCEPLGRHLRIWGSVIPWTDEKLVHLEYAEDITELKDSQTKLEFLASTDMLTLALNRPAFLKSFRGILDSAIANNTPVTLAFIDINDLKHVNDTFGHAAGDELICRVAKALKNNIRESDALGRFGGDEFVIAFNHCMKEYADKRMHAVLSTLDEITSNKRQKYSFSYGLAETGEIPYLTIADYADGLIELADKRMFEQKKKNTDNSKSANTANG